MYSLIVCPSILLVYLICTFLFFILFLVVVVVVVVVIVGFGFSSLAEYTSITSPVITAPCGVNSSVIKGPLGSSAFHNADGLPSSLPPPLPPPPPPSPFLWLSHRPESPLSCSSAQPKCSIHQKQRAASGKGPGCVVCKMESPPSLFFLFFFLNPPPPPTFFHALHF